MAHLKKNLLSVCGTSSRPIHIAPLFIYLVSYIFPASLFRGVFFSELFNNQNQTTQVVGKHPKHQTTHVAGCLAAAA